MPNQVCYLQRMSGNNVYGQPILGERTRERCSVVKFPTVDVKSSVRSDSSASRGEAHEPQSVAVVLLMPKTNPKMHDVLTVRGVTLKVTAVQPRWNAAGQLDHFEVTASLWSE